MYLKHIAEGILHEDRRDRIMVTDLAIASVRVNLAAMGNEVLQKCVNIPYSDGKVEDASPFEFQVLVRIISIFKLQKFNADTVRSRHVGQLEALPGIAFFAVDRVGEGPFFSAVVFALKRPGDMPPAHSGFVELDSFVDVADMEANMVDSG